MEDWCARIDLSHMVWTDYRILLRSLGEQAFPSPEELTSYLRRGLSSNAGKPIRFVPAENLPGVEYEKHIFSTGEISTRDANWHDLFNAMVWCRFPQLKVVMNAVHFRELESGSEGRRGRQRDGLTLFDESGVIVCSNREEHLQAIARHDWINIFQTEVGAWEDEIRVFVVGHALLEKFLKPYKSMTAHALLLRVDQELLARPRETMISALDERVAEGLLAGQLLDSPSCLSPLPLMGVPEWWLGGEQNDEFYSDRSVFRPLKGGGRKAPVFDCRMLDPGHGGLVADQRQS